MPKITEAYRPPDNLLANTSPLEDKIVREFARTLAIDDPSSKSFTAYASHNASAPVGAAAQTDSRTVAAISRVSTPIQEIMDLYLDPNTLPAPSLDNIQGSTLHRFGNVIVRGDQDAPAAYAEMRKYAVKSGRESTKVLASVERTPNRRVWVYPVKANSTDFVKPTTLVAPGREPLVIIPRNVAHIAGNGTSLSPADSAIHEFQHVAQEDVAYQLMSIGRGRFSNLFEESAITGAESEALIAHGRAPRDDHQSVVPYITKGPTSTQAANPAVEALLQQETRRLQAVTYLMHHFGVDMRNPPEPTPPGDAIRNGAEALYARNSILKSIDANVKLLEGRS